MGHTERRVSTISAESAKLWVNNATERLLSIWETSNESIQSPEEFEFENGFLDSISRKSAAGALRDAIDKKEIYFVIQEDDFDIDKKYSVGFAKPYEPLDDSELLIAIIPSDFLNRCLADKKDPLEVFEMCIEDLIFADIESASEGRKRTSYRGI